MLITLRLFLKVKLGSLCIGQEKIKLPVPSFLVVILPVSLSATLDTFYFSIFSRNSTSDAKAQAHIFTHSLENIIHGLSSVPNAAVIIYFFWTCFMLIKHVNTLSPSSFPELYWQRVFFLSLSKASNTISLRDSQ